MMAAAEPAAPAARPVVRAFDLGGSGLRTWLALVEPATRTVLPITPVTQIGKCSRGAGGRGASAVQDVRAWVRAQVPTLDLELAAGVPQCFALAGLDKLWADGESHEHPSRKPGAVADLFGMPAGLVFVVHDAEAHLVASQGAFTASGLPLPLLHVVIGTSVNLAALRADGSYVAFGNFVAACGCAPWDLHVASLGHKPAWQVLSGGAPAGERAGGVQGPAYGLWKMRDDDADAAVPAFQKRWCEFLTHTAERPHDHEQQAPSAVTGLVPLLLPALEGGAEVREVAVVATGGALDHHASLFAQARASASGGALELSCRHPVSGHSVRVHVMVGPPDAGLRGASLLPFLPAGQH